jgi:FtsH-binding integral membrane protein
MIAMHIWIWILILAGVIAVIFLSRRRKEVATDVSSSEHVPIEMASKRGPTGWKKRKPPPKRSPQRQIFSMVISAIVILSALFVILSGHYQEAEQKWAYGIIGTIIGIWLKTE